jgi:hypothetical protein
MTGVMGFAQYRVHAKLRELLREGGVLYRCEDYDLELRIGPPQISQQRHAISVLSARHCVIGDDDVTGLHVQRFDQFARVCGGISHFQSGKYGQTVFDA